MKTLWDWLQIVVAPATIALGVYWLNTKQGRRQREEEDRRRKDEQETELYGASASKSFRTNAPKAQPYRPIWTKWVVYS